MDKLWVIKIGGNIIDDAAKLSSFLINFAAIDGKKILVHGGGKLATSLAQQLNIPQQMIEGRRITDAETLKIVTMVYAGYINKNIVAGLQANGCKALGLSGADGGAILAHKRLPITNSANDVLDYGFVGDIDSIDTSLLNSLLAANLTLVIAPITADSNRQLLNTNADTIAQELAKAVSSYYETSLVYSFEKSGVLLNINDDNSAVPRLTKNRYAELKATGTIFSGMLPKLDNAFAALDAGVSRVVIGKADHLPQLISGEAGTHIVHDEAN